MRASSSHCAERGAVGERSPEVGVGDEHLEAAVGEPQLVDHELVEQADHVGARRHHVPLVGERPLEGAGAAEPLPPLEHEHRLAGPGQVGRGGQAVVAAADHDDVPGRGGQLRHGAGSPTSPSRAAMRFTTDVPSRGGRLRRWRLRHQGLAQVAPGHHGDEWYTASSCSANTPGTKAGETRLALHALDRRPVLAVGEVPEVDGVATGRSRAVDGLRREQPLALHPGRAGVSGSSGGS